MHIQTTRQVRLEGRHKRELARDVRDGGLTRIRRGAYAATDQLPPADHPTAATERHRALILATAPLLGDGTFFSHVSAAVLHGFPVRGNRLGRATVVRASGGHGSKTRWLHSRRAMPSTLPEFVDGIPLTGPARTIADLAATLPFDEAVMAADAALAAVGELDPVEVTRRGRARVERVLAFADARSESPGESLSRARMHVLGLPAPELQVDVLDGDGRFLGRADFGWPAERVLGEFDGRVKYEELVPEGATPADVILAEKRREQRLQDAGWHVIRWDWQTLFDSGEFETRIRRALEVGLRTTSAG